MYVHKMCRHSLSCHQSSLSQFNQCDYLTMIMGVPLELMLYIRKHLTWEVIHLHFYKLKNVLIFTFPMFLLCDPLRYAFSEEVPSAITCSQSNCIALCSFANGSSNAMLTFTHEKTSDLGASQVLRHFTSPQSITSFQVSQPNG